MLDGKIALVTGAGQGIGRAIALEMARQAAGAVVVADLNGDAAAETADLVVKEGGAAEAIECDLGDRDQVEGMITRAASAFDGLDVLVNNAGVIETALTRESSVETLPEDVWDAVYRVNLRAPWLTTKFAAPYLRRSTRGPNIVNAASVAGLSANAYGPAYGTTKAALIHLTKVTAVHLAPTVRCNCFCPGLIETPMSQGFLDRSGNAGEAQRARLSQQLIERPGIPDEVAKLVCFLASDDAAYITGAMHLIDGGLLASHGRSGSAARTES